jgi:hypothetical protein
MWGQPVRVGCDIQTQELQQCVIVLAISSARSSRNHRDARAARGFLAACKIPKFCVERFGEHSFTRTRVMGETSATKACMVRSCRFDRDHMAGALLMRSFFVRGD